MTGGPDNGSPEESAESPKNPRSPDHAAYVRRMKEAEARGEDPMLIAHEEIMAVLDWIKAKHSTDGQG